MTQEMIDIFDADLRPRGTKEIWHAHTDGDWHRTFHLWLVRPNNGGEILYQWRSESMKNFPDMLDVSAAGHLESGEELADGSREAEEELGVKFENEALHFLGYRVEVADQENGQKNREYQGVHMALLKDHKNISPDPKEVSGAYWMSIHEGIKLHTNNQKEVQCEGIFYDKNNGIWKERVRTFDTSFFIPRIQNYYLTAHIMAERLLENRFPLSIS